MSDERFDAAYFDRLYRVAETAVYTQAQVDSLASGVIGMIDWWGYPVDRVLDVGAGTAMWRNWLSRTRPEIEYVGVDVSAYACATYGHQQADIGNWCDDRTYDLIVCHGVVGYLEDDAVEPAIANLARMSRGFLFFHVSTEEDVRRGVLDTERSGVARRRPAKVYRDLLRDYYLPIGAGLWLVHDAPQILLELERAE